VTERGTEIVNDHLVTGQELGAQSVQAESCDQQVPLTLIDMYLELRAEVIVGQAQQHVLQLESGTGAEIGMIAIEIEIEIGIGTERRTEMVEALAVKTNLDGKAVAGVAEGTGVVIGKEERGLGQEVGAVAQGENETLGEREARVVTERRIERGGIEVEAEIENGIMSELAGESQEGTEEILTGYQIICYI
jgi:hypothetical protein